MQNISVGTFWTLWLLLHLLFTVGLLGALTHQAVAAATSAPAPNPLRARAPKRRLARC